MKLSPLFLLASWAALSFACSSNKDDHPSAPPATFDAGADGGEVGDAGGDSALDGAEDGAVAEGGDGAPTDGAPSADAESLDDAPGGKGGPVIGDRDSGTSLVCETSVRAFDLSRMSAAAATPTAFANAWTAEQTAGVPGLGLGFTALDVGPVTATVGAVYAVSAVKYAFVGVPSSARNLATSPGASPKEIKLGPLAVHIVVSFTSNMQAHGFSVSAIAGTVTLSAECDAATGQVDLTIPASNQDQEFGGTTVGAALGAPTVDTDHDGTNDAWTLSLTGTAPAFAWSGN